MPKAKHREDRGSKPVSRTIKYKLGNRKNSKSAHSLSSEDLIKTYFTGNTPKDKLKIAAVLRLRGVELVDPSITEEASLTK